MYRETESTKFTADAICIFLKPVSSYFTFDHVLSHFLNLVINPSYSYLIRDNVNKIQDKQTIQ